MNNNTIRWIALFICLAMTSTAHGQTGLNAKSMGMAGAYQGLSRGAEVSLWNPANLGMPGNPHFSMDFLNVGFSLGNNSLNINLYNDYFSQDYFDAHGAWDQKAKDEIIAYIPADGWESYSRAQVTPLAFSFDQFAISLNAFAYADASLPQNILRVPLQGLGTDLVELNDIDGEAIVASEIVASYGKMLDLKWNWIEYMTVGANLKYFIGHAYVNIAEAGGSLLSNADTIAINGSYRMNVVAPFDDKGETGHGVGLDLGTAVKINKKLSAGLSLNNVFGSIVFPSSEEFIGGFAFNQPGLNIDEFDNFGNYLDSVAVDTDTSFHSHEKIRYVLPKSFVLSATYRLTRKVILETDYHQGLNNTPGGTTKSRLAFGTELRYLPLIPIRFGIAFGGLQGTTLACGLGVDLGIYELDIAAANERGLFNSSKGINFAISQRLKF